MLSLKSRVLLMLFFTFLLFLYWDIKPKILKFYDLKIVSQTLQNDLVQSENTLFLNPRLPQFDERSPEEILNQYLDILTKHGYEVLEVSNLKNKKMPDFLETTFELTFSGDFVHLNALFKDFFAGSQPLDINEFSLTMDEKGVVTIIVECIVWHLKRI